MCAVLPTNCDTDAHPALPCRRPSCLGLRVTPPRGAPASAVLAAAGTDAAVSWRIKVPAIPLPVVFIGVAAGSSAVSRAGAAGRDAITATRR